MFARRHIHLTEHTLPLQPIRAPSWWPNTQERTEVQFPAPNSTYPSIYKSEPHVSSFSGACQTDSVCTSYGTTLKHEASCRLRARPKTKPIEIASLLCFSLGRAVHQACTDLARRENRPSTEPRLPREHHRQGSHGLSAMVTRTTTSVTSLLVGCVHLCLFFLSPLYSLCPQRIFPSLVRRGGEHRPCVCTFVTARASARTDAHFPPALSR